jgi:hypothetical protein
MTKYIGIQKMYSSVFFLRALRAKYFFRYLLKIDR